jgi:hypothetical protein
METKEKLNFRKYGGELTLDLLNDIVDSLYKLDENKNIPKYTDEDYKMAIGRQLGIFDISKIKISRTEWGQTKLIKFWYFI